MVLFKKSFLNVLAKTPMRSIKGNLEDPMSTCNFDKLLRLLDKELDLDSKLELYEHLDRCETCREAIYELTRDRDSAFLVYRKYNADKIAV
jgi:anti-sigma factor RsiW